MHRLICLDVHAKRWPKEHIGNMRTPETERQLEAHKRQSDWLEFHVDEKESNDADLCELILDKCASHTTRPPRALVNGWSGNLAAAFSIQREDMR